MKTPKFDIILFYKPLFFLCLITISSCAEEGKFGNLSNSLIYNKTQNLENFSSADIIPCNLFNCFDPDCSIWTNSFDCTRRVIEPCDFPNMGTYSQALCCELNKIANNCNTRENLDNCINPFEICVKVSAPPRAYALLHPNFSPHIVCSIAQCGE